MSYYAPRRWLHAVDLVRDTAPASTVAKVYVACEDAATAAVRALDLMRTDAHWKSDASWLRVLRVERLHPVHVVVEAPDSPSTTGGDK